MYIPEMNGYRKDDLNRMSERYDEMKSQQLYVEEFEQMLWRDSKAFRKYENSEEIYKLVIDAIYAGQGAELLDKLFEIYPNYKTCDAPLKSESFVEAACGSGDVSCMELLYNHKVMDRHKIAVLEAVENGHRGIVAFLMKCGKMYVNPQNYFNAVLRAIKKNDFGMVIILIVGGLYWKEHQGEKDFPTDEEIMMDYMDYELRTEIELYNSALGRLLKQYLNGERNVLINIFDALNGENADVLANFLIYLSTLALEWEAWEDEKYLEQKLKEMEDIYGGNLGGIYEERKINIAKMECLLKKDLITYPYSLWRYYGL